MKNLLRDFRKKVGLKVEREIKQLRGKDKKNADSII
jgi:hypothetical protein